MWAGRDRMSNELTKTELLFIRACKSKNPMKRVQSVYKKQYGLIEVEKEGLATVLASIIEKQCPMSISELIRKANPNEVTWWHFKEDEKTYFDRVLLSLVSHMRGTAVNIFNGYVSPAKMRNATTSTVLH